MRSSLLGLSVLLLAAPRALAQIQPLASDSFDYTFPAILHNQAGGAGWATPWTVAPNQNDVVVQANPPTNPTNPFPWPAADAIGNYAQQALEFGGAFRTIDQTGHADVVENGLFGRDGATLWFSFTTVNFQQFGDHFGALSLFEQTNTEQVQLGSPWASYGWGIDTTPGIQGGISFINGSDDTVSARLVVRIDYRSGDERLRMWVDPAVPHPASAADLDVSIPDHRWDVLRLSCGGSSSLYYWDNLVIEKGEPQNPIGTSYCTPATTNSTSLPATLSAFGSTLVVDDNVTLVAAQLPPGQFGYFLAGRTQGFFNPPNSQGIICLSGNIGRYNQVANIIQGPSGSLSLDLSAIPVNPPAPVLPGETWNFQCWYRDVNPTLTSNFTDGVSIAFQ